MTQDPTLDYFEKYRAKRREMENLGLEITKLRNLIDHKKTEANALMIEIRSMQRIITAMIDEGMDPVEVKMRNDLSELGPSMWSENDESMQIVTITGGTGTVGATGAIGSMSSAASMIGALGQSSYPPQSSSSILTSAYPPAVTSVALPNNYSATNIHKSTST